MALEGVIAQCYPIALLLVPHTSRKKNYKNDFLYYCAIGYTMTAFEQAWTLLKSIQGDGPNPINLRPWLPAKKPTITPLEERVADRPPVSHIEWNPNQNKYTLRGTGDEELSTLKPGIPMGESAFPEGGMPLMDILGETPREFGRKGYYKKLLRGLLNAGIDIQSDSRNPESNPFHQKFIQNLPPNLEAVYRPNSEGKINFITPINYRRKDENEITNFGASDLVARDYGALPIRNIPLENVREPIGSVQTRFPVIDDNYKSIKPYHNMNPIIPNFADLNYSFD